MERDGKYCQRKKGVKDNTKVFVLSYWVEDSGHIILWGTLGDVQTEAIKKFCFGQVKFEMPIRYPNGQLNI